MSASLQTSTSYGECEFSDFRTVLSNSDGFFPSFMGQLTLARFRGDTTFGLFARIFSTFFGGCMGTVIWSVISFCRLSHRDMHFLRYISTGNGRGNPYGLAAACGVCFPFFFYARLYWPGPPMTNLIVSLITLSHSYAQLTCERHLVFCDVRAGMLSALTVACMVLKRLCLM